MIAEIHIHTYLSKTPLVHLGLVNKDFTMVQFSVFSLGPKFLKQHGFYKAN